MGEKTKLQEMKKQYENVPLPQDGLSHLQRAMVSGRKNRRRSRVKKAVKLCSLCTAAIVAVLVILPVAQPQAVYAMSHVPVLRTLIQVLPGWTYKHESERFSADVQVPYFAGMLVGEQGDMQEMTDNEAFLYAEETGRLNAQINLIAERMVRDFQETIEAEEGYGQLLIRYEILDTQPAYFTLKLITYWGGGSGYEKDYYFTVNRESGRQIHLADLFIPGSDYLSRISENIKAQMREQMATDESKIYWIDQDPMGDTDAWNFVGITAEQDFYVDAKGQLVITFAEGEVAPMYMGTTAFVIPGEVLDDIRKDEKC